MVETKLSALPPQPSRDLLSFLHNFSGKQVFAAYNRNRESGDSLVGKHFPTDIHSCYTYLCELQNDGYEVYFTVNESKGPTRKAEDIVRARAVFVDDDTVRENGPRKDFVLKPSLIVETSKGKYHYYWLTSTTNLSEWKLVQQALIYAYHTDPKIKDLSRVMRLPTFKHYTGFVSKVVGGTNKMYSWDEIVGNYPPMTPEMEYADTGEDSQPKRSQGEMIRIIVNGKANTGLHEATRDLAWGLLKDGKSAPATIKFIRDLMQTYDMSDPRQKENYNIVERTVLSAARKLKSSGVMPDYNVPTLPLERDWSYLLNNSIPKEAIPESMYKAAYEVGAYTGAGEVPAILAGVVITSALLGRNVLIHEIDNSLLQRPRMGLVIAMHTGTSKSAIYEQMCEPFFNYQNKIQKDWEDSKHRRREEIDMLKASKAKLLQNYRSKDNMAPSEEDYLLTKLEKMSKRLEWLDQGRPALYIDDTTEERLVAKMYQNNNTMAILSDDARNTIKNIMGVRYSNNSTGSEGTYIAGLTGSTIDSHRQKDGGTDITLIDPVLNLLLFVQPDIATKFKQSEVYAESGLAARIPIYFYPISGEEVIHNRRKRERTPLDKKALKEYYEAMYSLCHRAQHHPLVVKLSEGAKRRHIELDESFENLLKDAWRGHYDKTNKISTLIVTYATVFAAIDDPLFAEKLEQCEKISDIVFTNEAAEEVAIGDRRPVQERKPVAEVFGEITYELHAKYINMGWQFAQTLFDQSIESYTELDKYPIVSMARRVIHNIANFYSSGKIWEGFTECAAFNNMMPVDVRADMGEIITHLVDKGWLVTKTRTQVEGKGRLNNGLPNKIVKPGDIIYELNSPGIIEARKNHIESAEHWGQPDIDLLNNLPVGDVSIQSRH